MHAFICMAWIGYRYSYVYVYIVNILLAALHGADKVHTYIDQVVGGELLSVVDCARAHCKHVSKLYSNVYRYI